MSNIKVNSTQQYDNDGIKTARTDFLSLEDYLELPFKEVLSRSTLPAPTTLIVSHNQSVANVLDQFHLKGSRCAAVERTRRCSFHAWITRKPSTEYAFFDVRDLAFHVMRLYQLYPCKTVEDILVLIHREKVWKVANVSGRVPFIPHQITEKLSSIIGAFRSSCRVPIFDQYRLVRVLTPADLLRILTQADLTSQIEARGNLRDLASREAKTIRESETLIKAMSLMERHGYSAIPIVSEQNASQVLDVITVKDIKYLLTAQTQLKGKDILNAPALSYINVLRGGPDSVNKSNKIKDWAMVQHDSSLEDIISIFIDAQIHRLILQDQNGQMAGLLTLSDVMTNLADLLTSKS